MAQDDTSPPNASVPPDVSAATETHAIRGGVWGAGIGGALGGLGLGVLAWGLCDAGECDDSFADGFLVGAMVGAAAGGLAGTVVGSAFPRGGTAAGGWSWSLTGGPRAALARELDGVGPAVALSVARGVTDRVRVGGVVEYLGRAERVTVFRGPDRGGGARTRTERRRWDLHGVRLEAERVLATASRRTAWISGGFGVYPTREALETDGDSEDPAWSAGRRRWVAAPGLSLAVGGRLPVVGRWSVEGSGRADLVLGVGSEDWLPLVRLGIGVRRGPKERR